MAQGYSVYQLCDIILLYLCYTSFPPDKMKMNSIFQTIHVGKPQIIMLPSRKKVGRSSFQNNP